VISPSLKKGGWREELRGRGKGGVNLLWVVLGTQGERDERASLLPRSCAEFCLMK